MKKYSVVILSMMLLWRGYSATLTLTGNASLTIPGGEIGPVTDSSTSYYFDSSGLLGTGHIYVQLDVPPPSGHHISVEYTAGIYGTSSGEVEISDGGTHTVVYNITQNQSGTNTITYKYWTEQVEEVQTASAVVSSTIEEE